MDFTEIMDFCGYDLDKAAKMAESLRAAMEEALTDAGLEEL